jgi:hypothetical protein
MLAVYIVGLVLSAVVRWLFPESKEEAVDKKENKQQPNSNQTATKQLHK